MPRAGVVLLVAVLGLALTWPAAAQGGSLPSAEAWYLVLPTEGGAGGGGSGGGGGGEPNPLCDAGLPLPGCPGATDPTGGQAPPADRPNPYPADTLHVSLRAGADDTFTLLELTDPLQPPGDITGGTLTLPVAGSDAGSSAVDTAEFQACAVTGTVEDDVEAGDPATAPTIDCTAASPAVYEAPPEAPAGEDPTAGDPTAAPDLGAFTVDLGPLASRWQSGRPAVALVPTDAAREAAGSWHVAFSGRQREAEGAEPISFTLEVEPDDDDAGSGGGSGSGFGGSGSGGSGSGGSVGVGTGSTGGSTGGSRPATGGTSTPARPASGTSTAGAAGSSGSPAITTAAGDPLGTAVAAADDLAPAVAGADGPLADAAPTATGPSVGLVYPAAYALPLLAVVFGAVVITSLVRPMRLADEVDAVEVSAA